MSRMGGARRKTRAILKKKPSQRGKFSLTSYFRKFEDGDKVVLKAEPAIHGGMYFRRFHAKPGTIVGKQGRCYLVKIKDFNKYKIVLVHPVHLRKSA